MKAVLVGTIGSDKVFYDIDAGPEDRDGAIEREDGSVVPVNFMSFASTARGLNKIRSSPFHRFLWDSPRDTSSGSWYETFITKEKPVNEKMLEKSEVHSSIGNARKNIKSKSDRAKLFISRQIDAHMLASSCCDEMIKFDVNKYSFDTSDERKTAWAAAKMLNNLEEN